MPMRFWGGVHREAIVKHRHLPISLPAEHVWLDGLLAHAPDVLGLAVILQTSVGQHQESREAYLAASLQRAGYATLILDLITRYEDSRDPDIRYNVPLLATRVIAASEWIRHQPQLKRLAVGLVAAGTGCGAAVRAAARAPERFSTLVCRAGRPDLAGAGPLRTQRAPLRLLVGSLDSNQAMLRQAYSLVTAIKEWRTVEGAGELFLEPGTLETAGRLTAEWLGRHLPPPGEAETPGEADATPEPP
jgi:putative phosphoribosyl transferase